VAKRGDDVFGQGFGLPTSLISHDYGQRRPGVQDGLDGRSGLAKDLEPQTVRRDGYDVSPSLTHVREAVPLPRTSAA
jgi:hypothetical protein